jgi:hypothetical protein
MTALAFLLVVSIVFNISFFLILSSNQKFILDKIEELKKKIDSKDNNLEIKKHYK